MNSSLVPALCLSHSIRRRIFALLAIAFLLICSSLGLGQQTLGALNGTVTDTTGAIVQGASIKAHNVGTNLEVTATSASDGSFSIADLPIGTYAAHVYEGWFRDCRLSPDHRSGQSHRDGQRQAQARGRVIDGDGGSHATCSMKLIPPRATCWATHQIAEIPLGTGSFTQAAILSPGGQRRFSQYRWDQRRSGQSGIWANGQRDTSNSFTFNGVSGNNIFNGKSTSQVTSGRVAVNIGENGNGNNPSGEIVTSTSVYGAIGQALPSPPPETVQEMHVNSAMYDASQGAYSGAHLEVTTKSGTNRIHGGAYDYYESSKWNANQWFYEHNQLARPPMHREVFGGFIGGPIKKDKLFYFASYQGQRANDQLLATSLVAVPPDLTSDRSAGGLAAVVNKDFIGPCGGTRPARLL